MAASKPAIVRRAASTVLATYTVRSGDTLSAIALRVYHDPGAWPVLYWANRNQVRWANSIQVGEVLTVPARPGHLPTAPRQLGPTHAPVAHRPTVIEQDAEQPASSVTSATPARARAATSYSGDSSFQAVRDRARVRRQQPGHELDRALRPVPVQRVDLGRLRREPG